MKSAETKRSMTIDTFFQKFDLFADAPDAVERMREFVLELAVRGELVEQDDTDTSASLLLQSATNERAKLVAAKKIRARPHFHIETYPRLFKLPHGWVWAQLSDVGHELGQKIPDKQFSYIDVGGIDADKGVISDRIAKLQPNEAPSRARKIVLPGTVIYATVRPYLLNIAIVDHEILPEPIASTAFGILHPFSGIENRYLFFWIRSKFFTSYVQDCMKGMAYPAINDENFYSGPIALPPFAEQKRIVAKVDELMALCDRLEAERKDRDARAAALARASLERFSADPSPANLEFLFHRSYAIPPADLRKAILELAVRGKLVKQKEGEEAVCVTFKRRTASTLEIGRDRFPPQWRYIPLGRIGEWRGGGTPSKQRPDFWEGPIPWVSPKDMKTLLIVDAQDHISEEAIAESSARLIPPGSILMVVRGMILARAFPVAITAREVTINQDMKALIPDDPRIIDFLLLALRAFESDFLAAIEHSTHGTCKLETDFLQSFELPLPPLAEQKRIVAKVDALMVLVDRLESDIAASREKVKELLAAVIAELVEKE